MRPHVVIGIAGFLALQLGVGLWVGRRVKTTQDFLLAGRRLGPWLATSSIFATWFGAETCISSAGLVYSEGLGAAGAEPFGYALSLALMGSVFAVRLWRAGAATLADLFRQRFGPASERLVALLLIPTSLLWAAAQIRAFGMVLASAAGASELAATSVAAAVVLVYVGSGGLYADAVTDLIQGVVLIAGLGVLLGLALVAAPAQGVLDHAAAAASPPARSALETIELWAVPIFGSAMAQELIQRVTASRSPQLARGAALGGAGLYLVVGLLPVAIGLVMRRLAPGLEDAESVVLVAAQQLLPAPLELLLVAALVAAMLSTVDSALLVSGSLLTQNLLLAGRQVSEPRRLAVNRLAVAGCALIAYGAGLSGASVHELVAEASSLGSAGIFVASSFALLSRFGSAASAQTALVSGLLSYLAFSHWLDLQAPFLGSVLVSTLAYVAGAAIGSADVSAAPGVAVVAVAQDDPPEG